MRGSALGLIILIVIILLILTGYLGITVRFIDHTLTLDKSIFQIN